jgi:hypothetical protein
MVGLAPKHDRLKRLVICALLALAGTHCALSIFYDNEEWLNLPQYSVGQERNPYQERIAMMPILRLAGRSPQLARWAQVFQRRNHHLRFNVSIGPEEMASILAGVASVWAALLICCLYGRASMPRLWWLPGTIALAILYSSYAARYQHALCYPYDLPHMFLFGTACACLLTGRPWMALAFFVLDVPMRETSIFFVALSFCAAREGDSLRRNLLLPGLSLLIWLAIRLPILHAYRNNASETGSRLLRNLHLVGRPLDWPTAASALGFLLIPVWLGRRHLDRRARLFLWLSVPCMAISCYFGILIETRMFVEWTIPFALLAAVEAVAAFSDVQRADRLPATSSFKSISNSAGSSV